jgi:4-coumarate--CoA ligase (photoactive yellow protein activation family)
MTASFELCVHGPRGRVASGEADARSGADLLADAAAIAARLSDFPVGSEIAVVCHDRYHFAASLLAAVHRGLVVALPPNAQPETVRQLRAGRVLSVLTDHDDERGIDVRELMGHRLAPLAPPVISAQTPFVVVYTSGSTGTPLACHKTAGQLLTEAQVLIRTFGVSARDHVVATVPPHHIYGLLFSVLVPLMAGASFSRETPFYADVVHRIVKRDGATALVSVPAHLRALSIMEPVGVESLARFFSSGAPLPAETRAMLAGRFGWTVTEILGSSETGGIGWREDAEADFTAFDVVEIESTDDGRMAIRSPYVPVDGPSLFVTNDRIELRGPGRFRHLGRVDGVVKIGSTRVSVAELEARLLALPEVRDAAVLAMPGRVGRGQETWAVLALEAGQTLSAEQVRTALRAWFDPVVIPRRYRFVDGLPREATGKLKREVLLSLFTESE